MFFFIFFLENGQRPQHQNKSYNNRGYKSVNGYNNNNNNNSSSNNSNSNYSPQKYRSPYNNNNHNNHVFQYQNQNFNASENEKANGTKSWKDFSATAEQSNGSSVLNSSSNQQEHPKQNGENV